jgi:hypothetical protein
MSKVCPKCGKELADNAMFCNRCGSKLGNQGVAPQAVQPASQPAREYNGIGGNPGNGQQSGYASYQSAKNGNYQFYGRSDEKSKIIINPLENVKAELKNSVAQNFITGGGITKNETFFTDVRLYHQGKRFSIHHLGTTTENFIVDLKDISATDIVHYNPIVFLVIAIIVSLVGAAIVMQDSAVAGFFILLFLLLIVWLIYISLKGTFIEIFFPGGKARLSVKMYSYQDVLTFHKLLRHTVEETK